MAQTIRLRRSSTASAVPTTGQLDLGEVAINTNDGKMYFKKDDGAQSIIEVSNVGHTHTSGQIGDFNTAVDARVTYETLSTNGDIGTGASQVAQGDHLHTGTYLQLTGGTLSGTLVLNADPTQNLHAATKQYVDNIAQGLDSKDSVKVATTANITLSGEQTIDGVLTSGDRVLVKSQTATEENGIYVSDSGAWSRASDVDTWTELVGAYVFIEEGTVHSDQGWVCTVNEGGTLDTTAVTWTQFSGAGATNLGGLTDVNVGNPPAAGDDGKVLQWDNGSGEFNLVTQSGGASDLDGLSDVVITTPATDDVLIYNGANWVNDSIEAGGAETTLASWTLSAGDLYYADFTHNLGTQCISIFVTDTVTDKQVFPEDFEVLGDNSVRVWVRGNTHSVKVCVVTGRGPRGATGADGSDGAVWHNGSGAPAGGTGVIGDYYINNTNGDYYEKTGASTWTLRGNLEGPAGGGLANVVEDTTPELGGDLSMNQKHIQFNPSLSSDLTASGIMVSTTVDTNATGFGAALYMASDGNFDEADADATSTMPCRALALESGTGTKKVLLQGFARKDSWNWTPGAGLFVSTTTGALSQTAPSGTGDQVQKVGYAWTADIIYFNPDYTVVEVA